MGVMLKLEKWGGYICKECKAFFEKGFPITSGKYGHGPKFYIPWLFIKPHNQQALDNHGQQNLHRLAERGGCSPNETLAILTGQRWGSWKKDDPEPAMEQINKLLEKWENDQKSKK